MQSSIISEKKKRKKQRGLNYACPSPRGEGTYLCEVVQKRTICNPPVRIGRYLLIHRTLWERKCTNPEQIIGQSAWSTELYSPIIGN